MDLIRGFNLGKHSADTAKEQGRRQLEDALASVESLFGSFSSEKEQYQPEQ